MKKVIASVLEFVSKYKSYIIIVIILITSCISLILENNKNTNSFSINDNELVKKEELIAIYITGEVNNPGVYYIEEGMRLNDIVELCGGFKDTADLSEINLAEKLNDSDKIFIPKIVSDNYEETNLEENNDDSGKVNINTANKTQLKELDGIGDTLADNIIKYRNNSKFKSIEDILNVDGIGQAKYEKIKEYICI
jgi:competence protein ComEA